MRPRTLGSYRLDRRLATGGMAEVFVARRLGPHGFEKRVALKCILPEHADDPDFVAMFVDEARLAAQLEHPGIVQVFDFGEADGTLFLAMELVEGTSVHRLLRAVAEQRRTLPLAASLHVGAEVARALAYAHQRRDATGAPLGLVHRDVSPANLLVTRRGAVKLSDFGIARWSHGTHRTDDGHVRGKLGYMSPEQVRSLPLDGRSDVFTLATVLFELLAGEPLFAASKDLDVLLQIRQVELTALDRHAPTLPRGTAEWLRRALSPLPAERPDAGEFAAALDHLASEHALAGRGSRELARAARRLGLVDRDPTDAAARDPSAASDTLAPPPLEARPSRAPRPSRRPIPEPPRPSPSDTGETTANDRAPAPPDAWSLARPDGAWSAPLAPAAIVRALVLGDVALDTGARSAAGAVACVREIPIVRRCVRPRALAWDASGLGPPTAEGELGPGVVLRRAGAAAVAGATGALRLRDGRTHKTIFFVEGRPDFIASTRPEELLGEFLVREGICRPAEVEAALAHLPRFEGRLGDALVALGTLRPAGLYRAVAAQVRERYLEAFRWRRGAWSWHEGARANEETYALAETPFELLRDAAAAAPADELEASLGGFAARRIVEVADPPVGAAVFRLSAGWASTIALEGTPTLGEIVLRRASAGEPVIEVYRALSLALSAGLLRGEDAEPA